QPSGEKVEKVEDIKGTTASSEGSITIVKPSKEESSSKPESNKQEQPEESKPEEAPQPSQKPEEKPQETKPVEPAKPQKPQRTWEYQSGMSQELWNDFNAYRQSQGLNALNWSGKYAGWTKSHCEEMAQKQSGFHKSYPEGGQIVYDGTAYTSASSILNGFKNSPAHNKNMLDPDLTEGACAVYKDSNGRYYTVIGFDY
ncbi:CAP domain-containing protein, partial [Clostridium perfringens]